MGFCRNQKHDLIMSLNPRAYTSQTKERGKRINSRIGYCQFHYPPSNANTQPAESELKTLKSDRTVEWSGTNTQIMKCLGEVPLYELCIRSSLALSENDSNSPSGIPDGYSADSQKRSFYLRFSFQKQQERSVEHERNNYHSTSSRLEMEKS